MGRGNMGGGSATAPVYCKAFAQYQTRSCSAGFGTPQPQTLPGHTTIVGSDMARPTEVEALSDELLLIIFSHVEEEKRC